MKIKKSEIGKLKETDKKNAERLTSGLAQAGV
jgi:hypothetical protein